MTKFDTRFVRSTARAADDARHFCFRFRIGDGFGRRKNESPEKRKKGDIVSVARTAAAMIVGLALTSFSSAQTPGPFAQADNPAATQADVVFTNYRFRSGETLPQVRIHYATLGSPHRGSTGKIDNAILVLHWTGSDSRALLTPAFMNALFGSGRPLDAARYYLIFADSIGCGRSSKPSDGLRTKFPHYTYGDMVDLQHKLVVETLHISKLHALLGMSMGGMNAWQWAESYPDAIDGVMPVVSLPIKVSGRNLIWRRLAVNTITDDPDWKGGYYDKPFRGWTESYQLLRMMIDGVPHLQAIAPDGPSADKFLAEAAAQSQGADPNDVLYSLKSSSDYDPEARLGDIRSKLYALNFDDDEFNPDVLQALEAGIKRVPNGRMVVQAGTPSSFGHLTMAHPELWATHVAEFMQWLGDEK
jgi:homoserine O-acetyltransferase